MDVTEVAPLGLAEIFERAGLCTELDGGQGLDGGLPAEVGLLAVAHDTKLRLVLEPCQVLSVTIPDLSLGLSAKRPGTDPAVCGALADSQLLTSSSWVGVSAALLAVDVRVLRCLPASLFRLTTSTCISELPSIRLEASAARWLGLDPR